MPARKRKPVEANDGSYAGLVLAAWDNLPEIDPSPLSTGPTKWRAEHCTTHRHGCDCREWEHACDIERLEKDKDLLIAAVTRVIHAFEALGRTGDFDVMQRRECEQAMVALKEAHHSVSEAA